MAEITANELPTAEEDPTTWNLLWVAGLPVPGTCLPIEGERKRDVEHKKSKGTTRDILIDQGLEPTECTIKIRTTDATTFRSLHDFYLKYMSPERALTRLNIVDVFHPQLYARNIKQGYFYAAPLPQPTDPNGIRPYISEFRFKIVGPKTQISANATSSKPKVAVKVGGPTDPAFKAKGATAWVGLISTSEQILPGVDNQSRVRPPTQAPVLYSPADVTKLAKAGDPTAAFVNSLTVAKAPVRR